MLLASELCEFGLQLSEANQTRISTLRLGGDVMRDALSFKAVGVLSYERAGLDRLPTVFLYSFFQR
jgi:hypothetical protein